MSPASISLIGWLARRCDRTPQRAALTYEGETWTYQELGRRIDGAAEQLAEIGVRPGDRIAYLDLNNATFLVALFAAARLGAIFVPLNFRLVARELAAVMQNADASVIIVGRDHRALIDGIRDQLPCRSYLSADLDTPSYPALRTRPAADPAPAHPIDADDVAVIMYSSGTTGRAKGAMLSHANLWWNNVNGMHAFDVMADDVSLVAMPLFHIGALNALGLVTLQKGGHLVLHRRFDPASTLDAIPEHQVTTMFCVPQGFQAIADLPGFADADLSSMRMLMCGGAPCPTPLLTLYAERGLAIIQGWGMTEAAPIATFLTDEFAGTKIGSAGNAALLCDIKLVDTGGMEIRGVGVPGEAYVRGPNVMLGYWRDPDATTAVLDSEGWFRTGDIAQRDEDGFYYIVDRAKDMIVSGGENVYSAEVEAALIDHPAIAEVAVVGAPDERWGETVVAVVVLAAGHDLTLNKLREWASGRLAHYKLPRRLMILGALPRNALDKVLKGDLRRWVAEGKELAR